MITTHIVTAPQEEDSSKTTHYAGPDHTVPTPIHRLPARESAVTTHPFTLSRTTPENTGKEEPALSTHLTAKILFIISKPPLLLCESNKSALYFGVLICCFNLSKTPQPLKLAFRLSIVSKTLMRPSWALRSV